MPGPLILPAIRDLSIRALLLMMITVEVVLPSLIDRVISTIAADTNQLSGLRFFLIFVPHPF